MRLRDYTICLTAGVIAVVALIIAGGQLDYINNQREKMKLVANEPLENAPPSLAFATIALGSFRGLLVDVMWIRAENLKEKGQFFDAKQLAEWISALQPRLASVWSFQAWNMAYNISVAIPASQPDQRWHWIKNGYELLRDKGIVYNPHQVDLYRELAWIFQHKIAGLSDDANKYYKLQLAESMEPLLAPATEEYFQKLTEAPKTLDELLTDPNITQFVNALKAPDKSFEENGQLIAKYLTLRENPKKFKPEAFAVIDNYRGSKTLEKFDVFAKAYQLRNVWKLDPELMQQINKTYGPIDFEDPNHHLPFDWRLADVHAIYWAVKGLQLGSKSDTKKDIPIEETNTDRIVFHSLKNLFEHGKMYIYKQSLPKDWQEIRPDRRPLLEQSVFLRYDFRMFRPMDESIKKIIEKYKDDVGAYESMKTGHHNYLKSAIQEFYMAGLKKQAQEIYREMRTLYPKKDPDVSMDVFLKKRIRQELQGLEITSAKAIINPLLTESYFLYAMRQDNEAARREQMASEIYKLYEKEYKDEQHRLGLPSMDKLRYIALIDFLTSPLYPDQLKDSLMARIKIEKPEVMKKLLDEENILMEEQQKEKKQQP